LKRNQTEFRLSKKPSKRNVDESNRRLIANDQNHKLNSREDFFYSENYLKINNTKLFGIRSCERNRRYIRIDGARLIWRNFLENHKGRYLRRSHPRSGLHVSLPP
jgi:hypothetical protein